MIPESEIDPISKKIGFTKWLMDPKTEYPQYWMGIHENPFKYCASIYGSQGFETDYVVQNQETWRDKDIVDFETLRNHLWKKFHK